MVANTSNPNQCQVQRDGSQPRTRLLAVPTVTHPGDRTYKS